MVNYSSDPKKVKEELIKINNEIIQEVVDRQSIRQIGLPMVSFLRGDEAKEAYKETRKWLIDEIKKYETEEAKGFLYQYIEILDDKIRKNGGVPFRRGEVEIGINLYGQKEYHKLGFNDLIKDLESYDESTLENEHKRHLKDRLLTGDDYKRLREKYKAVLKGLGEGNQHGYFKIEDEIINDAVRIGKKLAFSVDEKTEVSDSSNINLSRSSRNLRNIA